jgi:hypothetical protein
MRKKILILSALLVVGAGLLFTSLFFSDGGFFLRMDLTPDYSLRKELFANTYNLVRKEDGKQTIKDIGDWIIKDSYIYGRFKTSQQYFLLNRASGEVEVFPEMYNLGLKLRQLGMDPYDMSDEESFVHIKYHKRVYPVKK